MANPSPGNSITLRVEAPSSFSATSELAASVGAAGAAITALDVSESHHETLVVDVTCNTTDDAHAGRVKDALNALDVRAPAQEDILAALESKIAAYTTYEESSYAGPVAKLLTAVLDPKRLRESVRATIPFRPVPFRRGQAIAGACIAAAAVLRPKVQGALALTEVFGKDALDFLLRRVFNAEGQPALLERRVERLTQLW